jgi:hypothetical protein
VEAPAYVIGIFDQVLPTGATRAIDGILGGKLLKLIHEKLLSVGEGNFAPFPINMAGLLTPLIIFAGLGRFNGFEPQVVESVGQRIVRTLVDAHINVITTVPFGLNAGITPREFLMHFFKGCARGLNLYDSYTSITSLTLVERESGTYQKLRAEIEQAAVSVFSKENISTAISYHETATKVMIGEGRHEPMIGLAIPTRHLKGKAL